VLNAEKRRPVISAAAEFAGEKALRSAPLARTAPRAGWSNLDLAYPTFTGTNDMVSFPKMSMTLTAIT
jgi:hypothetical protein